MIEIKDNLFKINGKEGVVFGGEMHYFRVPKKNWKKIIKKIKNAGCNLISTYIPWCWHEYEEGVFDFNGFSREERDLITFLKIIKEENMYCIVRPGPYIMAEVKYEGIPEWIIKKYPEIIAKTIEGKEHPAKVVSYMHPTYLYKVKIWYENVCKIIKEYQVDQNGPVIMFQLDNEVGMLQWVTNQGDYSKNILKHLKSFLLGKYKDFEGLKKYYNLESSSIDEFITEVMNSQREDAAIKFNNDYSIFMRHYYKSYIETLMKYSKDNGINVPFIVNVHGFTTIGNTGRGNHYSIGLSQLYEAAKLENAVLAGDYYIRNITYDNYSDLIIANAFTKAVQNENQPLFSAEFQGGCLSDKPRLQPSDIDLSTRVCFGSGMNAVNYYMFVSGENYENIGLFGRRHQWQAPLEIDGKERAHYEKICYLGQLFNTLGESLVRTKKAIDTFIGFYPDYYMTEYKNNITKKIIDELSNQRDCFQFDGILKCLTLANISFEAVDISKKKKIDSGKIKSLWVFSSDWMDEHVQNSLLEYVKTGGKLFLYPTVPQYNLKGDSCTILKDAVKFDVIDIKKGRQLINIEGMDSIYSNYRLVLDNFKGNPIAWCEHEGVKEVCAFVKQIGEGSVIVFGAGIEHDYDYKIEMIRLLAEKLGIEQRVKCSDLWTNVLIRSNDDNAFVFINNFDEMDKHISIKLKDTDAFDGKDIYVPGRAGLILPIEYKLRKDLIIKYSTFEIYDCSEKEESIEISFRTNENSEGEAVIESSSYEILPQENIRISKEDNNKFKVNIGRVKGHIKIILNKKY